MVLVGLLVRYFFGVTLFRLSRNWRKLPQIHYILKSGGRIGSVHEKHHVPEPASSDPVDPEDTRSTTDPDD